ncbi:MAG: xanthine dehydrogenase family protein molybdopterin-binding subunit, partial [Proteobacteria bacterium]|nr:xanthine dehydrogenase family protein molybdopterin-binding subunit [Pseudomonadota bacterium]
MVKFGMGQSVPRTEDPRLLTGRGQYVSDVSFGDQAWGYAHRSPYAHAKILSIDTAAAEALPGVLAVYTYKDVAEAGLGVTKPHFPPRKRPSDGSPEYYTPHPGLASDKVYFVGDPVTFVVAETKEQAKDASELIEVNYEVLPSVTDTALATEPASPQLWDHFPNNISNHFAIGNAEAVEGAFNKAAHVVEQTFVINRISTNSMESRGCVGVYDPMEERYTLYSDTQTPHGARHALAEVFHVPETQIRIIARDIGGGFGLKDVHFPENRLCLLAAKNLGRPVKWVSERSEAIISDDHARDQVTEGALALDADGKFLAIRVKTACNMGAYITGGAAMVPTFMNLGCLAGVYTTPAIHVQVTCVFSNTQSTGPYRGAGRPEANYVLERLIDIAAGETGIDRIELRRRNTIPPEAMPFQTGLTYKYDSGEFNKNLDMALEAADYANYETRKADSASRNKLRGLGVIQMLEAAGGPMTEQGEIRFNPGGTVTVLVGTKGQGQGHETMYKILVSDMLGVEAEDIRLLDHDTDAVAHGGGTIGSRSAIVGGAVMRGAADK